MKRLLELFSGTHSVGIRAELKNYEIISLDRDLDAKSKLYDYISKNHIKEDVMTWDYKVYPPKYFNIITASPVCLWWSAMRRAVCTKTKIEKDLEELGRPMVDKVIEIIKYFNPDYYWIENPHTGLMKHYIKEKYPELFEKKIIVDYCAYDDNIGYMKRTIFFTNIDIKPKLCRGKDCPNKINGRHKINIAYNTYIIDEGKKIFINTKTLREKYKDYKKYKQNTTKSIYDRYKIPFKLIDELLDGSNK